MSIGIVLELDEIEAVFPMGTYGDDADMHAGVGGKCHVEVPPLEGKVVGEVVGIVLGGVVHWDEDVFGSSSLNYRGDEKEEDDA